MKLGVRVRALFNAMRGNRKPLLVDKPSLPPAKDTGWLVQDGGEDWSGPFGRGGSPPPLPPPRRD